MKGRIIDLSPSTAQMIGIDRRKGVAKVEVVPVAIPPADGGMKPAAEAGRENGQGGWPG